LVGVVLDTGMGHPDLQHPFFQSVLAGLRSRLGEEGFDLMLLATGHGGKSARSSLLGRCRHYRMDGLVLVAVDTRGAELEKVARSDVPCVTVDLDLSGSRTVDVASDNVGGAALAVRHLHSLGHERIGLIAVPRGIKPGRERLEGYQQELRRLCIPYRPEYVVDGDGYPDSGGRCLELLLSRRRPPSAVFVAADLMAAGALRAASQLGVRVPEDVAIVGFDDIPLAALTQPPLTTIRQDAVGLGVAAADALLDLLHPGPPSTGLRLPVELVVRETCGSGRVSSPLQSVKHADTTTSLGRLD
jgi:LacI family transcriptional regulator